MQSDPKAKQSGKMSDFSTYSDGVCRRSTYTVEISRQFVHMFQDIVLVW